MNLRNIERKILEYLVAHDGSAHREAIVCACANPDSNLGRGIVNGSNGNIARLMGSWAARMEHLKLVVAIRRDDGIYLHHEITDKGREALLPPPPKPETPPKPDRVRVVSVDQFHSMLKSQGVPMEDLALICPMCGTIQSARDLIAAGAGADFDEVEKFLGFSCVGRWTGAAPPRAKPDGKPCDWSLGGFFRLHRLAVVTPDGEEHPRFEPASPAQAKAHAKVRETADAD